MNDQLRIVKYIISAFGIFAIAFAGCGDTVLVRIKPVAIVSTNQTASLNTVVKLDGTGSYDPNDQVLTFSWALAEVPLGSKAVIIGFASQITSFTADKNGYYIVTLQVTNSAGSASDVVQAHILISGTGSLDPVAVIDAALNVKVNTSVTLNASSSTDPLDENLIYAWALVEKPRGSVAVLASASDAVTSFFADKGGYYTITLKVTNQSGKTSAISSIRIDAGGTGGNHPPVALIATKIVAGLSAMLDGSDSYDIDGDSLGYVWEVIAADAGRTQLGTYDPVFTIYIISTTPPGEYSYIVKLTVSDGIDTDSAYETVTITVPDPNP